MKRLLFSLLIISVISVGTLFSQNADLQGSWELTYKHDEPHLKLTERDKEDQWNFGGAFDLSRMIGFKEGNRIKFSLKNDAGEIKFSGNVNADGGSGTYEFFINSSYVDGMKNLGYTGFEENEFLVFTMKDFKLAYIVEFKNMGITIPKGKVVAVAALNITPSYAREVKNAGFPEIGVDKLIPFKALSVDAAKIRDLKKTFGDDLSESDMITFTAMKVDAGYAKEMKDAGFDLSPKNLISYKAMKITPEYLKEMISSGIIDADHNNILALKAQGIDKEFVEECKKMGFKDLSANNLIKLKVFKLDNDYIDMIRKAGYKDATLEQILQFKIMKIDADFIDKARDFNDGQLPDPDKLVGLKVMRNRPK